MKRSLLLLMMTTTLFSCGQTSTSMPGTTLDSTGKVQRQRPNQNSFHTQYEYSDPAGASLVIQNSFPRGGLRYKDRNGKEYVYAVFWTRIINETANPLELAIDFPLDSFEIPSSSGNYMNLLLPSDSMAEDKEHTFDYGLPVKSFLDSNLHNAASLKKIIGPNQSKSFYVVAVSNKGVGGVLRTGLSLRDQDLFYRINEKEIHCGKISLKNLRLRQ